MKTRYIAGIIAANSAIFFALGLILMFYIPLENKNLWVIASVPLFFFLNYFFARFFVRREIYEKVRTIYKNIYNFKVSKKDLKQKIKTSTIGIDEVNDEVEQWMEDSNKQLDNMLALEKFRKEYIGNVAHELRTPIFTIQGYVSTLLDGAMDDKELSKKYLLRAEAGIDRMIEIVQDLDTITQLELGAFPITYSDFDIIPLIKEIVDNLDLKAKERNIKVVVMNPVQVLVNADKDKIRQVLVNLIENAIKYSKDNGGEVRIKHFDMEEMYLIEVSDHGIGIEEKDINRVFERFYRTDKARSRQFGGSGIGLAIVKHIVEAHNQTINVRSKYGEGTVFGFTLNKAKN